MGVGNKRGKGAGNDEGRMRMGKEGEQDWEMRAGRE